MFDDRSKASSTNDGKCIISEAEKCRKWCRPILNVQVNIPATAQCNLAQSTSADHYCFMISTVRPPRTVYQADTLCTRSTGFAQTHICPIPPPPPTWGVHKLFGHLRRLTTRSGTDRKSTAWPLCLLIHNIPGALITLSRCEVLD
jgi:hypothetical protein